METKKCTKCKQTKPLEEFAWKSQKNNKHASECKECHKETRKAYYENNKEKEQERIYGRREEIRKWYIDLKKTLKCNRCPENHISTLQFHHIDPSEKEIMVAHAASNGWSKERILQEIEKCEILCANCHAKVHYDERV